MRTRLWIVVGLVLLAVAIFGSRFYEVDVPLWHYFAGSSVGVDPLTLHLEGEFVESNLGVAEEPNQPLTVRLIAQQYLFVPQCVQVPAGVPVRFRVTSADVVHSLAISGTSFQLKAVPGAVNESQFTFPTPGKHAMPCHEFCGAGHYAMRARVVVVPPDQFAKLKPGERESCAPR
jgi:cytochrome c oxidase subunit 2